MSASADVLVCGASNQIGAYLLPLLLERSERVCGVSRTPRPPWIAAHDRLEWLQHDLSVPGIPLEREVQELVYMAPLSLFSATLGGLTGLQRVVLLSSTSRHSKRDSPDSGERCLAASLADGEDAAETVCRERQIDLTILRPTLIYGAGLDRSLTRLARLIARWRLFLLPGRGRGIRQPVHAADLAGAVLSALDRPETAGCAYDLPGGESLEYRLMVERLFTSQGLAPRIWRLPPGLLALGLPVLRVHPRWRDVNRAMLERVDADLRFDAVRAETDLGFHPRPFRPVANTWQRLDRRLD